MADGKTRPIRYDDELFAGRILRPKGQAQAPFSDVVIVGPVYEHGKLVEGYLKLARPYAYVSGSNTMCASVLMGFENFTVPLDKIINNFDMVLTDRDNYYEYTTS